MVTFRKSFLLLAVIAMMATVANAQIIGIPQPFSCFASAGVPPIIRSEGKADLAGDIIVQCTGGTPTQLNVPIQKINFRIFANTNITSRLLNLSTVNWNEALLLVDDPAPANQRICTAPGGCSLFGVGAEPGLDYQTANFNVWQGIQSPAQTNSIEFNGVPIDPPGTQTIRTIRITNVRVNAFQLGAGSFIPSEVTFIITATGPNSFPINQDSLVVARIQKGLAFEATSADFLQCELPDETTSITFKELFPTAFLIRNRATLPDSPTAITNQNDFIKNNTETGFYNSGFDPANGAHLAGLASQGTRLVATFTNVPAGVTITVNQINDAPTGTHTATYVSGADSQGAGGTPMTASSATGTSPVTLDSSGSGAATWEVTASDPFTRENFVFGIQVAYTPNTQAGNPALGSGNVLGSYGPLSDIGEASTVDLQPRFMSTDDSVVFMTINSCATNLLWPFVTNVAGWDTGLAISNTSMDIFGTAAQSGKCEIWYFGNSNGSTPPSMDTTTVEIGGGGYAAWTLGLGGSVFEFGAGPTGSVAAAPGFTGYVIAHCFFQFAHGYAFITNADQTFAQGYIALVLDGNLFNREVTGRSKVFSEPLNQ